MPSRILKVSLVCLGALALSHGAVAQSASGEGTEFFEKRIRPVLVESCYSCHSESAEKLKAELHVDSREGLLRGGDTGPAVVPGDPDASLLIKAIAYGDPDLQMPPKTRLSDAIVADFRAWVKQGAPWPASAVPVAARKGSGFDLQARKSGHWAWSPVTRPAVPEVRDGSRASTEIDRFIVSRLEREGLKLGPKADAATRLRRLSFALTGLPPSLEATTATEELESESGWARTVDRMLASPQFGERWARHWLDKVRYAETMGHEFDYPILGAWRFRDYVVRAFNEDLPYDRFAKEQIAGDLLPGPRRRTADGLDEGLLATMQYWLCQQVHSPVDVRAQQIETVDNQLDVVTKSFLGLTVSCARCHDHKFDAISTRDYYALYGILSSSRYAISAADDPASRAEAARELRELRDDLRAQAARALKTAGPPAASALPKTAGDPVLRAGDRALPETGWFVNGDAFRASESDAGQPVWMGEGGVRVVRPGWHHGGAASKRLQGAIATPTFVIEKPYVHVRAAGRGARLSLVVEGFTLIQAPIYGGLRVGVRDENPHWITFDVGMWKGRRAWLEALDWAAADPATPLPGEYLGAEGWVGLGAVLFSEESSAPAVSAGVAPADWAACVDRWARSPGSISAVEADWIEAGLRAAKFAPDDAWRAAWAAAEGKVTAPVLVASMVEGTGWDEPVFIRGNHRMAGPMVKRRFLEALGTSGQEVAFERGTGRLSLAESMASPENPLFARVMVNWVWAHLFGNGLVASVDNFGVLGDAPSHPELLDWLASEFGRDGWSVKRLIRRMVMSETWQLASRVTDPEAERKDPSNRLWHRGRLRRLEGEALRDAMLSVAGALDPKLGGPSVPVFLTPFMEGRGRPGASGPLDGAGRRSLYTEVRRNFLSPWMLAFDMPAPATTVGRRSASNVPAQALALMNDPLVMEQARRWANRSAQGGGSGGLEVPADQRVERLFREGFGRAPTPEEKQEALAFLTAAADGTPERAAVWTDLCHALMNSKAFVFVE